MAQAIDRPEARVPPAHRPAPRPPVEVRPKELSVTGITTLIRDPYAIYARHVLQLRPLDPLRAEPDALARGSVLHRILEAFIRERRRSEADERGTRTASGDRRRGSGRGRALARGADAVAGAA